MTTQPTSYEPIPPANADFIAAASERIKLRMRRTSEDIIEIGKDLIEVKKLINHGQFGFWLENEFEMTDRTARNFIRVAERFGGKSEVISDFKPTILCELASPSTPDEVVEKAQSVAAKGEKVTVADVKKWKNRASDAEKIAKAAEKARGNAEAKLEEETENQAEEISKLQDENRQLQESLREALRPSSAVPVIEPTENQEDVEIFVPQSPDSPGKQLHMLLSQLQTDLRQPPLEITNHVLETMRNELLDTVTVIEEALAKLSYQPSHFGENR
jgi:hypothetical protein